MIILVHGPNVGAEIWSLSKWTDGPSEDGRLLPGLNYCFCSISRSPREKNQVHTALRIYIEKEMF